MHDERLLLLRQESKDAFGVSSEHSILARLCLPSFQTSYTSSQHMVTASDDSAYPRSRIKAEARQQKYGHG